MSSPNRLMASADTSRLPLKEIQVALRKTTEVLATELAASSGATPEWTHFEWCIAHAAAAMHGISPLLSGTLTWQGPESWQCFLNEQKDHTFKRHQRIDRLLGDIGWQAVRLGIAIVPMKGAALHEIGIYQPGERPMSDIDLLVRSADLEATIRLLGTLGYHRSFTTWRHWVFESAAASDLVGFGEHANNPIRIELHVRIAERLPAFDTDISDVVFPRHAHVGLNRYPSIASLMMHLLLHAAGNMCIHGLRLLHLHDMALLARRMNDSDWEGLLVAASGQKPGWVSPPLTLIARYYPAAIPHHIVMRAQLDCPWLLGQIYRRQSLSDVSLSNLWIQAFPGIEWSSSPSEMLRYVMSRIKPDEEVLAMRKVIARTHPGAAQISWSHLSQWRRIVRWVSSRPPRVETLSSVRAALAHVSTHPSRLMQHS